MSRDIVDLHTHLLPGVDDGVRTLKEAIEQLREAQEQGVSAVVCTPHVRPLHAADLASLLAERRRIYGQLVAAAEAEGALPEIGLGSEVLVLDGTVSLEPAGLRINETPYALVEIPFGQSDFGALGEVFAGVLERGHRPILAHVERYPHLRRQEHFVAAWQEQGVLTQVNGPSLLGEQGPEVQRWALALLEKDRIDVIASDVHGFHMRANYIGHAYDLVVKEAGAQTAQRLFSDNPRAIFEGRAVAAAATTGRRAR